MGESERAWRVTRLHHVAFAHEPADRADRKLADLLGLACTYEEEGPGFVERMFPAGEAFVQMLEATGEGVVRQFLDRRSSALHHVAFEVDAIDQALRDLASRGVRLVDERARPGGMGTRIAFMHPSAFDGMLVELIEARAHP